MSLRDLLTDEQIDKILVETFNKFDNDGSGELEFPEFTEAWRFLGLKGSLDEIRNAYKTVDTDGSGKILVTCIIESRPVSLNLFSDAKTIEIIQKLQHALGRPVEEVTDEEKLYKTLQDTFNAYDADGSRQMAFPEYVEAMRFIGKREPEDTLRKWFSSVE